MLVKSTSCAAGGACEVLILKCMDDLVKLKTEAAAEEHFPDKGPPRYFPILFMLSRPSAAATAYEEYI